MKLDKKYIDSLITECLEPIAKYFFRAKVFHEDRIPRRKGREGTPRIFISNHSGMAFPWDGMPLYVFLSKFFKEVENRELKDMYKIITAPALTLTPQMNPYFLKDWWLAGGGVKASFVNFESLLQENRDVFIYPEGVPGIGKGFNKRYELQRFSTSVAKLAIKYNATIVPLTTINGEYINPLSYNINIFNVIAQKLGMPFFPFGPIGLTAIVFPFMFYSGLPASLQYIFHKPLNLNDWADNKNYEDISEETFNSISKKLRKHLQEKINEDVKKYGKKPYKIGGYLKNLFLRPKIKKKYLLPFLWPDVYLTHWHKFYKNNTGISKRILRVLPYIIPIIGWLFVVMVNWERIEERKKEFQRKKGRQRYKGRRIINIVS